VIKLGGAALTDKKIICTPRMRVIRSAANQVAEIQATRSVLLVHGAGSYGHIPVKRFGLSKGYRGPAQLKGLSQTKFQLLEWESTLDRVFLQHKIPILPFLPSNFIVARRGRIVSCDIDPIKASIKLGCIPIAGGDIVSDTSKGFSIVSGDQLAAYMAIALRATMLVFATDVDGIFNSDPKMKDEAQLIQKLHISNMRRIGTDISETVTDVTGGMKGKLEEAATAASNGIPVFFVNLLKGSRLQDLVLGKQVTCSEVIHG
jgi:isopentenyl phosphate kinase